MSTKTGLTKSGFYCIYYSDMLNTKYMGEQWGPHPMGDWVGRGLPAIIHILYNDEIHGNFINYLAE